MVWGRRRLVRVGRMQQKVNHVHDEVRFAAGQRTYISVDCVLLVMASDG